MVGVATGDSSQLLSAEVSYRMSQERHDDSGHWYFLRKEIEENSPSRSDGIDLKKEAYLRKSYCTFLQDLGMRLKVPQVTIATAIIFCHRFFLRQSHAKNDRRTVATACMFLGGKVEETPRPLKDVILVSYDITHKKDPASAHKIKQKEVYEQQKELILIGERLVLATLGFDLNVQHPYKPLVEAIKKFKVAQNTLAQVAWNFVNDGLRTSLCLQFMPHHIAAGAIFLAAKFLKVKLPSDAEKVWWQEFDVTPRQLEEVSNQMLELYEQNKTPATQGSEAEGSVVGGAGNRAPLKTSSEPHQLPDNPNKLDDHVSSDQKSHSEAKNSESLVNEESLEDIQNVEAVPKQSPVQKIEKIDANKLKELREKRKKSRGEVMRKKESSLDEFDPILKELEDGVELAAAESKQGKSLQNVEDGEVSTLEDGSLDYNSPKSNDRKRKVESPGDGDITSDGKRWRQSIPGEI